MTSDLPAFEVPDAAPSAAPVLHEDTHVAVFEIVKPSLVPGKRWTLSDGQRHFGVEMEDRDFLGKVERRDVAFGHGDAIKVELTAAVPEGTPRILLTPGAGPGLQLSFVERWTFDSRAFKAVDPETYVRYAKKGGSWVLKPVGGGEQ